MSVLAREFIEAWQHSASLGEVAKRVGATKNACRVRAFRYRKRGIPLKEFPPSETSSAAWQKLAEYATELLGPGESHGQGTASTKPPGETPKSR
jgi:hypothetical protein